MFIAVYILTIGFMKQQTKNAVVKAREEERIVCENLIANTNLENQQKTTKTIIKYEKVKSNIANYDVSQRSKLLQQIEDFNFAD